MKIPMIKLRCYGFLILLYANFSFAQPSKFGLSITPVPLPSISPHSAFPSSVSLPVSEPGEFLSKATPTVPGSLAELLTIIDLQLSSNSLTPDQARELLRLRLDIHIMQERLTERPRNSFTFFHQSLNQAEAVPNIDPAIQQPFVPFEKLVRKCISMLELGNLFVAVAHVFDNPDLQLYIFRYIDKKEYEKRYPFHEMSEKLSPSDVIARMIMTDMNFCAAINFLCQLIDDVSFIYSAIKYFTPIRMSFQSGACRNCN